MFSILILTKNEEANLPGCLESVKWCDDVVVLDSMSSDRTREIARAAGARVEERAFDDFGSQRNHALEKIKFLHPWLFQLDADERFREELRKECEEMVRRDEKSAYGVSGRYIFMGKWIRHCTQYPFPQVRLVKVGEVRFRKAGHGQALDRAQRGEGELREPFDHLNFSKGIGEWVERHRKYAKEEAGRTLDLLKEPARIGGLLAKDRMERLRARKRILVRLPMRGAAKFLYLYFGCGGFLDGIPGLVYCGLQGWYENRIACELQRLVRETKKTSG
jgi:glycosyltransferase involved in cell wall biosynthesis